MKLQILEGSKIYEDGKLIGPLNLQEGERAGPFIIIESFTGSLTVVEPTIEERAMTVKDDDGEKRHLLTMEGRFQMADMKNANNRIYPNSIWEKVFKDPSDVLKSVDRGEMLGESDHPKDGETRLSRVAGKVSKLWRNSENKKEIMGRFNVFDTEAGRNLLAIHEGGGRLGVSSRGQGSVVRIGGQDVVQEDFKLQTWDVVHNPSTPGAYPEEVTEAVADRPTTQPKETDMSRLAELETRLSRLRSRELGSLSEDAVSLIRENVEEIQTALTAQSFDNAGQQAKLVTEATNFLRDLSERKTPGVVDKKHYVGKEEGGKFIPGKLDESTGDIVHFNPRAESADDVVKFVTEAVENPPTDLQEATKVARRTYREAVGLEGPLSSLELEGVAHAAKALIEKSESMDEKVPVIRARLLHATLNEGKEQVIEATSERELRQKLAEALEGNENITIEIDRSEAVYAQCAQRFSGLLETQTLKADQAVREGAANQATVSEMSAKLTGAKQLIEAFAAKHKEQKGELTEVLADLEAASTILEAVGSEFRAERLRGAVVGIAATNPRLKGLSEALSSVTSVEEAISATSTLQENSQPAVLDREPDPLQAQRAQEASEAARKEAEKKLTESTKSQRSQGNDSGAALTTKVVAAFPNPRGK
jgi:hypothetical protein